MAPTTIRYSRSLAQQRPYRARLIAILFAMYSGKRPDENSSNDAIALFQRLGLREHLTPSVLTASARWWSVSAPTRSRRGQCRGEQLDFQARSSKAYAHGVFLDIGQILRSRQRVRWFATLISQHVRRRACLRQRPLLTRPNNEEQEVERHDPCRLHAYADGAARRRERFAAATIPRCKRWPVRPHSPVRRE